MSDTGRPTGLGDALKQGFARLEQHPRITLLVLLVIGAILRATNIGYTSFWLDELYSFQVANGHFPPGETLPGVQSAQTFYDQFIAWQPMDFNRLLKLLIINVHLPLYYLLLNPWLGTFGISPETLRSFSAVFSVLLILPLYGLGKAIGGVRTGLLVALVATLNPMQLYYAQEGRMYTLTLFWAILSSLALWKVLYGQKRTLLWSLLYTASLVAGFFSHYVCVFFLSFQAVFAGVEILRHPARKHWLFALPAAALGLAAWIWLPIYQQQQSGVQDYYHFAKGLVAWTRYLEVFVWHPLVLLAGENVWSRALYIPMAVVLILSYIIGRVKERDSFQWRSDGLLLCWFLVPLVVQVSYDFLKDTHTAIILRYLVLVSPVLLLLLGCGLSKLLSWPRWGVRLAGLFLIVQAVLALGSVWAPSPFRDNHNKRNVRDVMDYFAAHQQPGDLVMVNGPNAEASLVAWYLTRHNPKQPLLFWVKQERGYVYPFPTEQTFAPYRRVWFYHHRSNEARGLDQVENNLKAWYPQHTTHGYWQLYSR